MGFSFHSRRSVCLTLLLIQCPIKGVPRSFYQQDNLHVEPKISFKLKKTKRETSGLPALGLEFKKGTNTNDV